MAHAYDDWLQDSGAYERFAGFVESDEERGARETEIARGRELAREAHEHARRKVMDAVLRRCPFCGGNARLYQASEDSREDPESWVMCEACGASTKWCNSAAEAVARWNARAEDAREADHLTVIMAKLDRVLEIVTPIVTHRGPA